MKPPLSSVTGQGVGDPSQAKVASLFIPPSSYLPLAELASSSRTSSCSPPYKIPRLYEGGFIAALTRH